MFLTQTYKHLNRESIISSDIKQNIFPEYIEYIKDYISKINAQSVTQKTFTNVMYSKDLLLLLKRHNI